MKKKTSKKRSFREDNYSKSLITANSKSFTTHNIIQDFSFNDVQFKHAKFINKIFGNSKFIKAFLRLIFPSLFWGLFTALVPILFNTMINGFYNNDKIGNQLYLSVSYTTYMYSFINVLVCSFVYAAFPAIGNYIAQHNKAKLQEVLRWTTYISLIACVISLVLEEIFARQIAISMIWQYSPPITGTDLVQLNYSIELIRWFSATSFFFLWLWLYVPTLASMKSSRALFYSSLVGFIYFIIIYPSYLVATHVNVSSDLTLAPAADQIKLNNIMNGIGGIYFGYFIIQPLFLLIYTMFPTHFKVWEAHFINFFIKTWNGINKFSRDYQNSTRKKPQRFPESYPLHSIAREEYTDYERDILFFQTGFKVTWYRLKQVMVLAWVILLDQIFYAIMSLVLVIYGTNFHGYWGDWNGIKAPTDPKESLKMAETYYKHIFANVSLISTYIFTIYNGFSLLPQYFVAYYIGAGDKQTAYHNSIILTNWSILFGFMLAVIIIIYGAFINRLIYSGSPDAMYSMKFKVHGAYITKDIGTYQQLWNACFNMELIYAIAVLFDTGVAMTYYILASGGSKFIVFADSLISFINAVALIILHDIHYDNFYVYYLVNRLHTFFKFFVTILVIYMKGALWGIDSTHSKKSWFKQKIIANPNLF